MEDVKQLGWFKFYRSTQYNKVWKHDPTAWRVFEALMMLCNRYTGEWSGGRFQLAEFCGLNASTTYKALKRLEKAKMITLSSNNRFTTISLCNWSDYQSEDNTKEQQQGNNRVTTGEQQGNTLTRRKKKEERIKKDTNTVIPNLLLEVIEILGTKEKPLDKRKKALGELLKDYTPEEIKQSAEQFRDNSDWHRKNGFYNTDQFLHKDKFHKWYAKSLNPSGEVPLTPEERKKAEEHNRLMAEYARADAEDEAKFLEELERKVRDEPPRPIPQALKQRIIEEEPDFGDPYM